MNRFRRAMALRDSVRRGRLAALAEDAQQGGQGDDADFDEKDQGLGVVHHQGSTLSGQGGRPHGH